MCSVQVLWVMVGVDKQVFPGDPKPEPEYCRDERVLRVSVHLRSY